MAVDYKGPYVLDREVVTEKVPEEKGNYLFLRKETDSYTVGYVGRSEKNLRQEILQQMGTYRANHCTHFVYALANTVRETFETECREYHKYGGKEKLNNRYHPDQPAGHNYPCPEEGCEYNEED